jgi:plastocyanin
MKKHLLILFGSMLIGLNAFSATHILTNSGNNYVPANLQVNLGDIIIIGTGASHTTRQVSQSTWNTNDTNALAGGFGDLIAGDTIFANTLGDIYYVCIEHVEMNAMKGIIKVSQLGIEAFKPLNLQILQSISEQKVELVVTGGSVCEMHVEMLNLSGQTVRKVNIDLNGDETSAIIEVGDLPKGVYMIRWSCGNVNKARKIILQ